VPFFHAIVVLRRKVDYMQLIGEVSILVKKKVSSIEFFGAVISG